MGIQDLKKFLKKHGLVQEVNLSNQFRHKVIPNDIASVLYQHRTTSTSSEEFLSRIKQYVVSFLWAEVHVLFVFDGKAPIDKIEEQQRRVQQYGKDEANVEFLLQLVNNLSLTEEDMKLRILERNLKINVEEDNNNALEQFLGGPETIQGQQSYRDKLRAIVDKRSTRLNKVTPEELARIHAFLTEFNIPWITAPGEAEAFCAYLTKHRPDIFAPVVLTEDSDCLCYGVENWLSGYNSKTFICQQVNLNNVIETLGFVDFNQFLDFCILSGCDYNQRLSKHGPETLLKKWVQGTSDYLTEISNELLVTVKQDRCRELFVGFGTENNTAILNDIFATWLSKRKYQDCYWDLDREIELLQLGSRNASFWGLNENLRCKSNWKFI